MADDEEESDTESYTCPECGDAVPSPADEMQNVLICPTCGHQFFIEIRPVEDDSDEAEAREALERKLAEKGQDFDAARVRALAAERKAIIRLRSYWLAAAGACVVGIGQCIWTVATGILPYSTTRVPLTRVQYIALFVVIAWCLIGLRIAWRKARAIAIELDKPLQTDPETPPDFSTLSDGSQAWKNLEHMNAPTDLDGQPPDQTPADRQDNA